MRLTQEWLISLREVNLRFCASLPLQLPLLLVGFLVILVHTAHEDGTECSEMSAHKIRHRGITKLERVQVTRPRKFEIIKKKLLAVFPLLGFQFRQA